LSSRPYYYLKFENNGTVDENEEVEKYISVGALIGCCEEHFSDEEVSMASFSAKHPGVLFELGGDFEGEQWITYALDGKSYTQERPNIPPFNKRLLK